ncbi:hypothetical protein [Novosphingobium sp. SL115]|uniref:hypothetical protein n=1 Tax=Novosphingobium sp. SL115 TaxID=2995150 RepID=UPI002DD41BCB|nr:hypothetical protein [Novosphingobium sp. SL115]
MLALSCNLFGVSIVWFAWVRIGRKGQGRAVSCACPDEAARFARQLRCRQASAPTRIGGSLPRGLFGNVGCPRRLRGATGLSLWSPGPQDVSRPAIVSAVAACQAVPRVTPGERASSARVRGLTRQSASRRFAPANMRRARRGVRRLGRARRVPRRGRLPHQPRPRRSPRPAVR